MSPEPSLPFLLGQAIQGINDLKDRVHGHGGKLDQLVRELSGIREELIQMNGSIASTKSRIGNVEEYMSAHTHYHANNVPIWTRKSAAKALAWASGAAATVSATTVAVLKAVESWRS